MVTKIVSGGQTGADRAALDVAISLALAVGGWVPRDRMAEDGPIASRYPNLIETESTSPRVRTERNVRDSDATVILSHGDLTGGSALTLRLARLSSKPVLHLDLATLSRASASGRLRAWLASEDVGVLNVAGPRASGDPRIFDATVEILTCALADARHSSCPRSDPQ